MGAKETRISHILIIIACPRVTATYSAFGKSVSFCPQLALNRIVYEHYFNLSVMPFVLNAVPLNTNPTCAGTNLLTKRNFGQPSLLRVIGERTMAPRTTRASKPSSYLEISQIETHDDRHDNEQKEMDVDAPPLSSDEEEDKPITTSASVSPTMARRPKFSPPRPIASLSKNSVRQEAFISGRDLDELFPSSQPKKKRRVDYTARNINTARDEPDDKIKPDAKFAAPAALQIEEVQSVKSNFKPPRAVTELGRRSSRNAPKSATFQIPCTDLKTTPVSTGPKFRMPVLDEPDSSAPSLTDSVFDIPEASQTESRKRSGSTSSLSSHSSIELNMSLAEQRGMAHDDTGDGLDGKEWERCDICAHRVERALFRELTAKFKGTGIRRRQRICAAHKKRKAEQTWLNNGYPNIDWEVLESERIPMHMPHLSNILHRKASSFYRTKLDVIAQEGRKALNNYLKDGVINVARQGYYGPRGARIMGHAITTTMETELAAQLKSDKVVRAAGFGGYVSAVLVPELMVALVKEDMRVESNKEAMQILDRSTEDGALINGDDDEVVLRAEEDD